MNRQATQRILAAGTLAALFAAGIANAAIRPPQDGDRERPQQARKEHRQEARAEGRQQARQSVQAQQVREARQAQFQQRGEDRREATQERRDDRRDAMQQARGERRDWQQDRRDDQRDARQDRREDRQDWRQDRRDDQREARQDRREDRQDWRHDRRDDRSDWRQDARSDARQRIAYARYQQDYNRRMRDFHFRVAPRYYVRPAHYRYFYGGTWYTTSNYGADVLRQAVDWGYREGVRAGRADRNDGWAPDYRDSVAWRDGGFGYGGRYVGRADYAYYFRQGFQRGYDDGYFGRMQYGRYRNNDVVIAEAVIATILGLQLLR
jgi:hypothetical protein